MGSYHVVKQSIEYPTHSLGRGLVIAHICNDIGRWGAGVSGVVGRKWPRAEREYRMHWQSLGLGKVQLVPISPDLAVANMIAQHGIVGRHDFPQKQLNPEARRPPIRYGALATCMKQLTEWVWPDQCEIACPRFGSGLAGGNKDVIEEMVWEIWCDRGYDVTVYEV